MGTTFRRLTAGLALLLLLVSRPFPAPAQSEPDLYVALGDSFTAGPLIPVQEPPLGCLKSTNNWPKMLAKSLALPLRDASCSGAQTKHMTEKQEVRGGSNPPQFESLDAEVDLVTLQIGGNDIGFGDIAQECGFAALQLKSCKSTYVKDDGQDVLRERIADTAPKIAAVLREIRHRAPEAELFVLGYPGIFRLGPEPPTCLAMGNNEADGRYLREIHEALNAMIADLARRGGPTYVDVYEPSRGKTACDTPVLRWVEPFIPAHAAAPLHPNINGMQGVAGVVAGTIEPSGY